MLAEPWQWTAMVSVTTVSKASVPLRAPCLPPREGRLRVTRGTGDGSWGRGAPGPQYARVEVVVEGVPMSALVRRDGTAAVDPPLHRRLELLASLGEVVGTGRRSAEGDDPLTSVLAILRASDLVVSVTFLDDRSSVGVALGTPVDGAGGAGGADPRP